MTAVFGDYDTPRPLPAQDIECESLLLSDRAYNVPGWQNRVIPVPESNLCRMIAKEPRCLPQRWSDADIVVWLDANLEVRSKTFVRELVAQLGDGMLAAFRHNYHSSISQEANLASTLPKYADYDLKKQVADYLSQGHPDAWGLWMTGVMIRDVVRTAAFGEQWLKQIERWGPEDQISLPYVLRQTIGYPVDLPFEGWWQGTRFFLHRHNDGT